MIETTTKKREIKGHIIIERVRRSDEELEEYEDEIFKIKKSPYKETRYIKADILASNNNKEKLIKINEPFILDKKFTEDNEFILIKRNKCFRCGGKFYPEMRYSGKVTVQKLCPLCRTVYWQIPRARKIHSK